MLRFTTLCHAIALTLCSFCVHPKMGLLTMYALFNSTFYAERHPLSGVSQYNHILLLLATKKLCRSNWSNPRPKSSQLASFEFKMQLDVLAACTVKLQQSCLSGDFLSNSAFFTSLLIISFCSAFSVSWKHHKIFLIV